MKINYKNNDLKIINRNFRYGCLSCSFNSSSKLHWCILFCRSGKIWIEDICNSVIFKL